MQALVLERKRELSLRDIDLPSALGPDDARIAVKVVGICGSDIHYYLHGAIGPYEVRDPMVLGHEASGVVTEVGRNVTHLAVGDRVCMEPGIPDWRSRAARLGLYNLDPDVKFWATPPYHGCLAPSVVHPASLVFKLPDAVSFAEGAFVEPLAVGLQAANKANMPVGATAVVTGAGPIGLVTALAALAAGAARVFVTDIQREKLAIAGRYQGVVPIDVTREDPVAHVHAATGGWGADAVFEASGSPKVFDTLYDFACPGGAVVIIGMTLQRIPIDIVAAQIKELRVEHVFRYAHIFPRAIDLLANGRIDIKPLISRTFPFERSVEAFEFAAAGLPGVVKTQIALA